MNPTIEPCGVRIVPVTIPSPTSVAGECTAAPAVNDAATAAETSSTPQ